MGWRNFVAHSTLRTWRQRVRIGLNYHLNWSASGIDGRNLDIESRVHNHRLAATRAHSRLGTFKAELTDMDINAFKRFEYRGWQGAVENYDQHFSPLTRQTIGPLLDAVQAGPNTSLLDVASGPGHVAAAAQRRGAKAVGFDFSEAMIERACVLYPTLLCCLGDAEQLPFGECAFDAGAMNFGILHLAQPETAIREAHRVLRPEGRFAFSVWDKPERAVGFGLALRAIEKFGDSNAPPPEGPPFFRFSDPAEFARVFEAVGFSDMEVVSLPLTWKLNSADDLFDAFYLGTARTGGLLRSQSASTLAVIREAICKDAVQYVENGRLMIPMSALVVAAMKS